MNMKVVLIAVGAYLAYLWSKGELGSATAPAPSPVPAPQTASTAGAAATLTLSAIYNRMVAAAGTSGPLGPDAWGYYLNNLTIPGVVAPAPESVGIDRTTTAQMSAADYWAAVSPAIAKATGLSGLSYVTVPRMGGRMPRLRTYGGWVQ